MITPTPPLPLERFPSRGELIKLGVVLSAGWLALTVLYFSLGYLEGLDHRVRGADSVYYYIYLPSLFQDGDLDLANNLHDIYGAAYQPELLPNGRARNVFSVGPALFWSPFYLLAEGIQALGFDLGPRADHLLVYIGNGLYGLLGIWLCGVLALHFVSLGPALLAAVGLLAASQMSYYLWSFTAMSHNVSLFSTALFLLAWLRWGPRMVVGVAAGVMILARWQNALMLLPALLVALDQLRGGREAWLPWLRRHVPFALALFVGLLPQLIAWQLIYDQPLLIPQGSSFIDFTDLPLGELLFSTRHGLFSWHPLLALGAIGLLLLWRRNRPLLIGALAALLAQTLLNAAVSDWWASWSFGQRRFINSLPLLGLGVALLTAWLTARLGAFARWGMVAAVTALGAWNLAFVHQYQSSLIFHSLPLTWSEMTSDKFRLPMVAEARKEAKQAAKLLAGDPARAEQLAAEGYAKAPDQPLTAPVYAITLVVRGNQAQALELFQRLADRHPSYPVLHWGLADALAGVGRRDDASQQLDLAPGGAWKERARARLESGAGSLLDQEFLTLYKRFLEEIATQ